MAARTCQHALNTLATIITIPHPDSATSPLLEISKERT
jgi:hypothetical protein